MQQGRRNTDGRADIGVATALGTPGAESCAGPVPAFSATFPAEAVAVKAVAVEAVAVEAVAAVGDGKGDMGVAAALGTPGAADCGGSVPTFLPTFPAEAAEADAEEAVAAAGDGRADMGVATAFDTPGAADCGGPVPTF